MNWLVYILQSEVDGVTQNIEKRLLEHNTGESKFTSTKTPWKLVYSNILILKIIKKKLLNQLNNNTPIILLKIQ
jgi:predicted GIY-YIG superfamily endonuclease